MKVKIDKIQIFYLLIIILFFLAILSGGVLQYLLFFTFSLFFITSIIVYKTNSNKIELKFNLSDKVKQVGQSIVTIYYISNKSFIPITNALIKTHISSSIGEVPTKFERVFIGSYDLIELRRNIEIKYRGNYDLGIIEIILSDMFFLYKRTFTIDKTVKFTALPALKYHGVFPRVLNSLGENKSTNKKSQEDNYNIHNIRKYISGDSLRVINWKVSAKLGELYSKNYQSTITSKILVLLDSNKDAYDSLEKDELMVEYFLGFLEESVKLGVLVEFIYFENTNMISKNFDRIVDAIEFMTTYRFGGSLTIERQISNILKKDMELIVFTPSFNNVKNTDFNKLTIFTFESDMKIDKIHII
jgi:uncharacterized protein (DUF58 family)